MLTFQEFDLLPSLQETLREKNLKSPTEIQARAMPILLGGRSVVGVSETGSGKTLSYALPVLHRIKGLENAGDRVKIDGQPRALVVVPTRELGEQVAKVFKPFTHTTRLRVRTLLGGTAMDVAKRNIAGNFEVLVATPGRLVKFLQEGLVSLSDVRMLVFDEADQIMDQGFFPDTARIAASCPEDVQMALFSATISSNVQKLISEIFEDAEVIRTQNSDRTVATLKTVNRKVPHGNRVALLSSLLSEKVEGGTMIFTNTREQCDAVAEEIRKLGLNCTLYRGEMDKLERRRNLKAFREGKVDILISTDLASRGLDLEYVGRVINYHLPQKLENYIHRVGRTARAGRSGVVVNLVTERDQPLMSQVDRLNSRG